jgi:hypothetical protein
MDRALGLPLDSELVLFVLFILNLFENCHQSTNKRVVASLRFLAITFLMFAESAALFSISIWLVQHPCSMVLAAIIRASLNSLKVVSVTIDFFLWIVILRRDSLPLMFLVDFRLLSFSFLLATFALGSSLVRLVGTTFVLRGLDDGLGQFQVRVFDGLDFGGESDNLLLFRRESTPLLATSQVGELVESKLHESFGHVIFTIVILGLVISHILDEVVITSGGIALEEVDHEVVTTCHNEKITLGS